MPPKHIVDKLHAANIVVMNMIGHPKHIVKALEVGCDMVCAQGGQFNPRDASLASADLLPKQARPAATLERSLSVSSYLLLSRR